MDAYLNAIQAVEVQSQVQTNTNVLMALVAVTATCVGGLVYVLKNGRTVIKDTQKQVAEVNNAVNNIGPGEHRLYDKVSHALEAIKAQDIRIELIISETAKNTAFWDDFHVRWGRLPEDLDDGTDVVLMVRDVQRKLEDIQYQIQQYDGRFDAITKERHGQ